MLEKLLEASVKKVLEPLVTTLGIPFINTIIADYGKLSKLAFEGAAIRITGTLNGLPNTEIWVECKDISISEDGGQVTVGSYRSNMPFAENALNKFATQAFDIPDAKARMALATVRKVAFA